MRLFNRVLITAALLAGASVSSFAAELKIGIIDVQRAIGQSDAGREAREAYFLRAKQYQDQINKRSTELNRMREQIEKEVKDLKKGERIPQSTLDKDREYGNQARDLQRALGGYQEELKVLDAELTRKVLEKLAPVLEAFAVNGKFDYILRAGEQVIYASKKQDITEAVIAEFNKTQKK